MARTVTTKELRTMPLEDLEREARLQEAQVMKLVFAMCVGKEKDVARYRREKRKLAQMLTVLHDKRMAQGVPHGTKSR